MAVASLDSRDQSILDYLRSYFAEHRWMPTVREIGDACAIPSLAVVSYHLTKLERAKLIEREHGQSRCIRIVERS